MVKHQITIGACTSESFYLLPFIHALTLADPANYEVIADTSPDGIGMTNIHLDGNHIGVIDYCDWNHKIHIEVPETTKVIFKYQVDREQEYANDQRVVSCGLYTDPEPPKQQADREIDVMSRMRTHRHIADRRDRDWAIAREILCETAARLNGRYNAVHTLIPGDDYLRELSHCKIGYNWRGIGFLNWRIPEYIANGIVMMTHEYGYRYPIRQDLVLEDGVNCIVENDPHAFERRTIEILNSPDRLDELRNNVRDLWYSKLEPVQHGQFLLRELLARI